MTLHSQKLSLCQLLHIYEDKLDNSSKNQTIMYLFITSFLKCMSSVNFRYHVQGIEFCRYLNMQIVKKERDGYQQIENSLCKSLV
jgi:hypothetical protein